MGIATDVTRSMTDRIQGLVTRFEQGVLPGLIRVWCGGHQLDLILQDFSKKLLDEQFYSTLTAFIVYLRRKQNLISEMKSQVKKLRYTHWGSIRCTSSRFKAHCIAVLEHVQHKKPSCAPSMSWWIVLIAVENISSVASIAAKTLQGQTTLVSNHREALGKLVSTLTNDFGVLHVSDSERKALGADKNSIMSDDGHFGVSVESLRGFMDGIGTFVVDFVKALKAEEL